MPKPNPASKRTASNLSRARLAAQLRAAVADNRILIARLERAGRQADRVERLAAALYRAATKLDGLGT